MTAPLRLMPLVFTRHGAKLYARTPAGEFQWGEHCGLSEWRAGFLIHYSGGDRQGSAGGVFLTRGHGRQDPAPAVLGFQAAVDPARLS